METDNKQSFSTDKNGNMISSVTYKAKDVTITVDGAEVLIGKQEEYVVPQTIDKEKIPVLKDYLLKSLKGWTKKREEYLKTVELRKYADMNEIAQAFTKLPMDKITKGQKKLAAINKLVDDYYVCKGAQDQIALVDGYIATLSEQLDFITKME